MNFKKGLISLKMEISINLEKPKLNLRLMLSSLKLTSDVMHW